MRRAARAVMAVVGSVLPIASASAQHASGWPRAPEAFRADALSTAALRVRRLFDVTSGLKARWTFDANASDISGNAYNGTLTNGAAVDNTVGTNKVGPGKLLADGVNDYVDVSTHRANFTSLTQGTVSAWIKTGGTSKQTILSLSDLADGYSTARLHLEADGRLGFVVAEADVGQLEVFSTTTLNDNAWHHVAVTVGVTGNKLYIDGAAAAVTYSTGTAATQKFFSTVTGVDYMGLGLDQDVAGFDFAFSGLIDDERIYDRALSASDIAELSTGRTLSGNVYEDLNYGGGAGRNKASSTGASNRSGARVELYTSVGLYSTAATTDGSGNYTFSGLIADNYYVRVVNNTVTSSRTGYTTAALPVMTYKTDATTGSATAVTDHVGGTNPSLADPGNGALGTTLNTSTFVFSAGLSGTAQSVTPAVVSASNISALDVGFSFSAVVNTNNSGQGSLRQFIDNANLLGGDGSLAQAGLVSAKENAVFMISNGTSAAGLRAANNYFSGGIATISPTAALSTISTPMVLDAQKQPGWSSTPILELNGTGAGAAKGLYVTAGSTIIRGFVVNRFGATGIELVTVGNDTVQGNYIGTNAAGTAASANGNHGLFASGVVGLQIGGTTAATRNVISANTSAGIYFDNVDNSTISGNYVGPDVTGTSDLNGSAANTARSGIVLVNGSSSNTIGGTSAGARNIISANNHYGLEVMGATSQSNVVAGNYIGTTVTGLAALPNVNGGASFWGAGSGGTGNTVGGTTTSARNVISGNTGLGVLVGSAANGSIIHGNYIGVGSDGTTAIGNSSHGVSVEGASTATSVGGTTASTMGNVIANNGGSAVVVQDANTSGAAILGNAIYANTAASSIDLGANGATANDGAKTAGQPNLLMDKPVITSASLNGTTLTLAGYVGSAAGQSTFASARVELFKSDNDASGFGEGQAFLTFVTSDASGNINTSVTVSGLSVGDKLTATATDGSNNTSEFGANVTVAGVTTLATGTDPSNASIAPSGAATMADAFTLQTSSGTDAITAMTVTLASGTAAGLSLVEITNDAGSVVYGSAANPGSDTPAITLSTNITATTTLTQYKIRVTPKSHANMPAPVGSSYAVTARISAYTSGNAQAGSDVAGTTVTIDNLSPGNVTLGAATAGLSQVALAWTNPGDTDLGSIVVLRRPTSAVTDTPAEGTTYSVGTTIGSSTVACVVTAPTATCTDTGLSNGTAYHYKVFARDANGNYATGATPSGSPATPQSTTLATGTDPGNASIAPSGAATMVGAFTFQTSGGTDAITAVTVVLATGTSAGLALVEITNDAGSVVHGSVANPGSDAPTITLSTNITANTTSTQYKIRITPKSHANMPAPLGSTYAVTARISAWTGTNGQAGSDGAGTTVTIDNLSPGNVTASTATAGLNQVALAWTNPVDADLGSIIVLRRTTSVVTDTPVEGSTYTVGNTVGASTVACVVTAPTATCTDTGLSNGTAYYYRIFARDANGNYSTGVVPTGSPTTPLATTLATGSDPSNASIAPGAAATMAGAFTFQTANGTDAITAVTVSLAKGTAVGLSLVEITNDAGSVVYGSSANPASDTPAIALTTNITATTTLTQYKIRITPKTHVNMPAPAGASYAVTAMISAWTGTNGQTGTDAAGTTVTIDNLSPGNVTLSSATPGLGQVVLTWTNPGDGDLGGVVVLRRTTSVVTDAPVEGVTYTVGTAIGSSTVACVVAAPTATCTDTGLSTGTAYYYKSFARDANGNYATGVQPTGSPATPVAPSLIFTQNANPTGTQSPGTDITFTSTYTNVGNAAAHGVVIANPTPANTDFKVGTATSAPGTTGLTVVIAYSSNGGSTWTYTPVSGAGGAPAGYDRLVTNIRWTFSGTLSQTAPNNSGSVAAIVRIR